MISKIKVRSITDVNDLLYCEAILVTEMLGVKSKSEKKKRSMVEKTIGLKVREPNKC